MPPLRHRTPDDLPDFEAPDERVVVREIVRIERSRDPSRDHVLNGLILASIIALVGSVIALNKAVTGLQVTSSQQEKRIDRLEAPKFSRNSHDSD